MMIFDGNSAIASLHIAPRLVVVLVEMPGKQHIKKDPPRAGPHDAPALASRGAGGRRFLGLLAWDWLCGALLVALTLVFFARGLADPAAMTREDAAYHYQPYYTFVADEVRAGRMPNWCPYAGTGIPYHEALLGAVLYPFRWHQFWMDYPTGYVTSVIFHFALAALMTYLLLRGTFRCGPAPSMAGAASFAFGGFTMGHVTHPNFFLAYPWFVLAIHLYAQSLLRSRWAWAVGAAVPVGLIALAGSPHMLLILGFGLCVWGAAHTAGRAWRAYRDKERWSPRVALPLGAAIVAMGLGGVLGLAQLWPAQQQAELSSRVGVSYTFITEICAHPWRSLLRMVAPFYYGNYRLAYWGEPNFHEESFYAGAALLLPAAMALLLGWRDRRVIGIAVFMAVMFVTAAGRYLPFYRVLFDFAPGFNRLRDPVRFMVWAQLGIAVLAAIGLQRAADGGAAARPRRQRGLAIGLAAALLVAMLAAVISLASLAGDPVARRAAAKSVEGPAQGRAEALDKVTAAIFSQGDPVTWTGLAAAACGVAAAGAMFAARRRPARALLPAALVAMLVLDLGMQSLGMLHNSKHLRVVMGRPADVQFLQEHLGTQRYACWPPEQIAELERNRGVQFGLRHMLVPPVGSFYTDRQELLVSLVASSIRSARAGAEPDDIVQTIPNADLRRVVNLLGVRYFVSPLPVVGDGLTRAFHQDGVYITENTRALPLAFLARGERAIKDANEILMRLARGDDPREVAYVEGEAELAPPAASAPAAAEDEVRVESSRPGEYRMQVSAAGPRRLVLIENWHPEWKCAVDGTEARIAQTDFAGMSVRVPPGRHEARWWYDPARFRQGLAGTAGGAVFTLAVLVAAPLWRRFRRRKESVIHGENEG
jgi:hypothetical protein